MKTATVQRVVIKEAEKAVVVGKGFDYKDVAAEIHRRIEDVLFAHPKLEPFFEDMPDGFDCPRAFLRWLSSTANP